MIAMHKERSCKRKIMPAVLTPFELANFRIKTMALNMGYNSEEFTSDQFEDELWRDVAVQATKALSTPEYFDKIFEAIISKLQNQES